MTNISHWTSAAICRLH